MAKKEDNPLEDLVEGLCDESAGTAKPKGNGHKHGKKKGKKKNGKKKK